MADVDFAGKLLTLIKHHIILTNTKNRLRYHLKRIIAVDVSLVFVYVSRPADLGSAVAMLAGAGNVQGVVRFLQLSEEACLIDGTIDGLDPGPHGLHVHTLGDLTRDCLRWDWFSRAYSAKDPVRHFNP